MKIFLPLLLLTGLATSAQGQDEGDVPQKQGRIGISVKVGPAFPLVDFSDIFTTGFTGFVDVPYNLTEDLQVYLGLGFSHFTIDNSKLTNQLREQGENATANIDAPYQLIPLVLGFNYSYRYQHFWPYFTMSLGMYFQKLEASGSLTTNGVTTPVAPTTQTWSQDAFAVGIGSLIPLGNEGWAIDLNAKYNTVVDYKGRVLITTTGGGNIGSRAIRYVNLLGGLSYTFR
jgi:hypothetical protein